MRNILHFRDFQTEIFGETNSLALLITMSSKTSTNTTQSELPRIHPRVGFHYLRPISLLGTCTHVPRFSTKSLAFPRRGRHGEGKPTWVSNLPPRPHLPLLHLPMEERVMRADASVAFPVHLLTVAVYAIIHSPPCPSSYDARLCQRSSIGRRAPISLSSGVGGEIQCCKSSGVMESRVKVLA